MTRRVRDRIAATIAIVAVVAVGVLIVRTVMDAERRGSRALEKLQDDQLDQTARAMSTRVAETYRAIAGIVAAPPAWTLLPGNATDQGRLDTLLRLTPSARTGTMVVDADGRVTAGTLLQSVSVGGQYDRLGLDSALSAGQPTILPVDAGATTTMPTLAVFMPLTAADGRRGAFLFESEVAEDSAFNAEVKSLARGRTGEFIVVDERGTVLAASKPGRLGKLIEERSLLGGPDGIRHRDGTIEALARLDSVKWRMIFRQDQAEFEGGLSERLSQAVSLVLVAMVIGGWLAAMALLSRLRTARAEQQRLADINRTTEDFATIVSQELRAPVAGVLGFLETAMTNWDGMTDTERLHAVSRASGNARRLHHLTSDVLDTAALDAGELVYTPTVINLMDLVHDTARRAREMDPGRTVTVHAVAGPVWVRADPNRMEQVLSNLLDNAMKNSPDGADVEVRVTAHDGEAAVAVIDHGPGLPPTELERVFERFVRGRAGGRGTGLGLYICRQLVEAHGGRIWASSLEGNWAAFTFTLPLVAAPADRAAPSAVDA